MTPVAPSDINDPDPAEIREALARLIASETLRNSPQLSAFLTFVVEAALRGDTERIKGYTIGVEALGRSEKFDPQADPIVRVEATRLRRAMARYYVEEGARDPIIVELPRGSYVPVFRWRTANIESPPLVADDLAPQPVVSPAQKVEPAPAPHQPAILSLRMLAVFAGLLMLGALLGPRLWPGGGERPAAVKPSTSSQSAGPFRADGLPPGNGLPNLAIAPFTVAGVRGSGTLQTNSLRNKLSDAFARFDLANIITYSDQGVPIVPGGDNLTRPDYILHGTVEYHPDRTTSLRFHIVDTQASRVIWSHAYDRLPPADDASVAEDKLVLDLGTIVMPPYGVIRSRERAKQLAGEIQDPRRRCVVIASESARSFDPALSRQAMECLEQLTGLDPAFSLGYSYLSIIYNLAARNAFEVTPSDMPIEDRALFAAQRGVDLRPGSSHPYIALCLALQMRGDRNGADRACEQAIALNRYDQIARFVHGMVLITSGELARGKALLLSLTGAAPARFGSSYHFYLFVADYLQGDTAAALQRADLLGRETNEYALLARTLAAQVRGDRAGALRLYQQLLALRPGWGTESAQQLRRYFYDTKIIERMTGDLATLRVP